MAHFSAATRGWDLDPLLTKLPAGEVDPALDALVQPLAEMALLSYVSTVGSYFRPDWAEASPSGWRRVLTVDPGLVQGFGMRAIVFTEVQC
jgi:hypothetical protein